MSTLAESDSAALSKSMTRTHAEKKMSVVMQQGLYDSFAASCETNHRNVSEVIRELMAKYIDDHPATISDERQIEAMRRLMHQQEFAVQNFKQGLGGAWLKLSKDFKAAAST